MADIVIVPNTDNPVQVNVQQPVQIISVTPPSINTFDISAGLTITVTGGGTVTSVNTIGPTNGDVTIDTDDVDEGDTNLYYTEARVSANSNVVQNASGIAANLAAIQSNDDDISDLQTDLQSEAAARAAADTVLTNNYDILKSYVVDTETDKITLTRDDPNNAITIDKSTGSEKIVLTSGAIDAVEITDMGVATRGITITDAGSGTPAPFTLPVRDGSNGQVLKTDGSGSVSWGVAPLSSLSIDGLTTAGDYDSRSDIWVFGGGSTLAGTVHYLTSSSTWSGADANVATAKGMLGVAAGTDPDVDGVVVRGFVRLSADSGGSVGDVVYLSETSGAVTSTPPSTIGAIVRVVGYKVAANIIFFNPSPDWVELS